MTECINTKDNKFGELEKSWLSKKLLLKNFSISQELFSTKSTETPKLSYFKKLSHLMKKRNIKIYKNKKKSPKL